MYLALPISDQINIKTMYKLGICCFKWRKKKVIWEIGFVIFKCCLNAVRLASLHYGIVPK